MLRWYHNESKKLWHERFINMFHLTEELFVIVDYWNACMVLVISRHLWVMFRLRGWKWKSSRYGIFSSSFFIHTQTDVLPNILVMFPYWSQFHQQFMSSFCHNFLLPKKIQNQTVNTEKDAQKHFHTKKLLVKCWWWNWPDFTNILLTA